MSDLEAYTRHIGARAFWAYFQPSNSRLVIGQFEGLREKGRARLRPGRREKQHHHSGYLLGHLTKWLHERGWAIDLKLKEAACYAAAIATPEGQKALDKEDPTFKLHVYAMLLSEKKLDAAISDADERMLYGWLCEQTGVDVTPARVAKLERLRAKRHERNGRG